MRNDNGLRVHSACVPGFSGSTSPQLYTQFTRCTRSDRGEIKREDTRRLSASKFKGHKLKRYR